MTHIETGTPRAHSQHAVGPASLGALTAYAVPAAIAVAGIVIYGWNAISWQHAAASGAVAALAFWLFNGLARASGATRMDLLDLLGSMFAPAHSGASRFAGFIVHEINGALLGVAYAYGLKLAAWPTGWGTGLIWGAILWALALLLMSSIGAVHPAIRNHQEDDPGPAAINFGRMTPIGALIGHLIYGVVLGWLYAYWRF